MIPITLVLDNARYQKCQIVQALADALHIELLYLPPYSPNLNLIERLWKFVKKKCLYAKYYSDFPLFSSTISDCLAQPHIHFKLELTSLLTLKFQSLANLNDLKGTTILLEKINQIRDRFPRLSTIWVDRGYSGKAFILAILHTFYWCFQVVVPPRG